MEKEFRRLEDVPEAGIHLESLKVTFKNLLNLKTPGFYVINVFFFLIKSYPSIRDCLLKE